MPLVTLTILKPKTAEFKNSILRCVHGALVSIGVPETDLFQRVLELPAEDFRFDANYPDVKGARGENFALVEILLSVGRSVKIKKTFFKNFVASLQAAGHNPEEVMVVFKETGWENWSFAGGRQIHVE